MCKSDQGDIQMCSVGGTQESGPGLKNTGIACLYTKYNTYTKLAMFRQYRTELMHCLADLQYTLT